jgi:hypothetical protein
MDFLFLHLDTLKWNDNPTNLISYLVNADLSPQDLLKLRTTRYLPAHNDKSTMFAPRELYLNNKELDVFPFVRFLQWPSLEGMSSAQRNFLIKLGVREVPPLSYVMSFLEEESAKERESRDETGLDLALQYLCSKLGPTGVFENEFGQYKNTKFLPCIRQNIESGEVVKEVQSPSGECVWQ